MKISSLYVSSKARVHIFHAGTENVQDGGVPATFMSYSCQDYNMKCNVRNYKKTLLMGKPSFCFGIRKIITRIPKQKI